MAIYVWGTGCGASELVDAGFLPEQAAAFVDSRPSGPVFLGRPVILPEQLEAEACELIIVTTRQVDAVAKQAAALGIGAEKLLFMKNHHCLADRNADYRAAESLLGQSLLDKIIFPAQMIRKPAYLHSSLPEWMLENDYVRLSTLELLCRRVADVPGVCAELGVYQGAFSQCINLLLPDRKLYLFDSFEGFLPEEASNEGGSDAFVAAHRNTQAERVLASMPHREQVIPRIGWFPHTAEGLEERYCLVSLDADFEESTLEGLRYFWPRLSEGGYLLLHDYHSALSGVARAVERYETETGVRIPMMPICDIGGTMVLCK